MRMAMLFTRITAWNLPTVMIARASSAGWRYVPSRQTQQWNRHYGMSVICPTCYNRAGKVTGFSLLKACFNSMFWPCHSLQFVMVFQWLKILCITFIGCSSVLNYLDSSCHCVRITILLCLSIFCPHASFIKLFLICCNVEQSVTWLALETNVSYQSNKYCIKTFLSLGCLL